MIVHRQVFSAVARAAFILIAGTCIMANAQTLRQLDPESFLAAGARVERRQRKADRSDERQVDHAVGDDGADGLADL